MYTEIYALTGQDKFNLTQVFFMNYGGLAITRSDTNEHYSITVMVDV